MPDRDSPRIVYTAGAGRVCPGCGWPAADCHGNHGCRCSQRLDEPLPPKITAKLRLESKGRSGKSVTVVDALPRNGPFLASLEKELKRSCGTGGTVREGAVELQGDQRERVRQLLAAKGFAVKG